jgi:hypothetical protein
MVTLKRIKTKEDLKDVLAYLIEDVSTYEFVSNYRDITAKLSKIRDTLGD